jgi:hypothetical protein
MDCRVSLQSCYTKKEGYDMSWSRIPQIFTDFLRKPPFEGWQPGPHLSCLNKTSYTYNMASNHYYGSQTPMQSTFRTSQGSIATWVCHHSNCNNLKYSIYQVLDLTNLDILESFPKIPVCWVTNAKSET